MIGYRPAVLEKARLVDSGEPFKVDLEARGRKLKTEQVKIWRHRAGVLFKYLLKPFEEAAVTVLCFVAGCSFAALSGLLCSMVALWLFSPTRDDDFFLCVSIGASIGIGMSIPAIACAVSVRNGAKEAISSIRAEWNP